MRTPCKQIHMLLYLRGSALYRVAMQALYALSYSRPKAQVAPPSLRESVCVEEGPCHVGFLHPADTPRFGCPLGKFDQDSRFLLLLSPQDVYCLSRYPSFIEKGFSFGTEEEKMCAYNISLLVFVFRHCV